MGFIPFCDQADEVEFGVDAPNTGVEGLLAADLNGAEVGVGGDSLSDADCVENGWGKSPDRAQSSAARGLSDAIGFACFGGKGRQLDFFFGVRELAELLRSGKQD